MKKIFLVAGARPNFVKIAPIERALRMHRDQPSTQSYAVPRRSEDSRLRKATPCQGGQRIEEWMIAWLDDKCWDNKYAGMLAPVE